MKDKEYIKIKRNRRVKRILREDSRRRDKIR